MLPDAASKCANSYIFIKPKDEPAISTAVLQSGNAYVIILVYVLPVAPLVIPLTVAPEQPAVAAISPVSPSVYGK